MLRCLQSALRSWSSRGSRRDLGRCPPHGPTRSGTWTKRDAWLCLRRLSWAVEPPRACAGTAGRSPPGDRVLGPSRWLPTTGVVCTCQPGSASSWVSSISRWSAPPFTWAGSSCGHRPRSTDSWRNRDCHHRPRQGRARRTRHPGSDHRRPARRRRLELAAGPGSAHPGRVSTVGSRGLRAKDPSDLQLVLAARRGDVRPRSVERCHGGPRCSDRRRSRATRPHTPTRQRRSREPREHDRRRASSVHEGSPGGPRALEPSPAGRQAASLRQSPASAVPARAG
jgi:hypothetical protein